MQQILQLAALYFVPTIIVVVVLVEVSKSLGVQSSEVLRIESFVLGLLFTFGFALTAVIPADFAGWFMLAVYGLLVGGVATLMYKLLKDMVFRAIEKFIQEIETNATAGDSNDKAAG